MLLILAVVDGVMSENIFNVFFCCFVIILLLDGVVVRLTQALLGFRR